MGKNLNLQYFISYLGFFPYLIIIIDKFFLHQIDINILDSFTVYYSIIILVFIGSINWNLNEQVSKKLILYGFFPSLFSVITVVLYLYNFNIFFLLIFYFLLQLVLDYFIIYKRKGNRSAYYKVRLPLTSLIVISLFIIQ